MVSILKLGLVLRLGLGLICMNNMCELTDINLFFSCQYSSNPNYGYGGGAGGQSPNYGGGHGIQVR